MGTCADRLLSLMYEWLREARDCSSNLRALAQELESLREDCNAGEMVGSTLGVIGAVTSIAAAPFTGGASVVMMGAVTGGIGATISVVSKITEQFKASSKLKRVKEIDERCNEIADKIQELFEELRGQCPSSCTDEQDMHVVKEFLRAMARRNGLDIDSNIRDLDDLMRYLKKNVLVGVISRRLASSVIHEVLTVLQLFSLMLEGTVLPAATAGAKQIGKTVVTYGASKLEGALISAAAKTGGKQVGKTVAIRGASRMLGGVVGLAFSLPEAIESWTNAIENKHETDASKSLRDNGKKIEKAAKKLSSKLSTIEKAVRAAARVASGATSDPPNDGGESDSSSETESSSSDSSSSESESDEEETKEELKIGLINARSAKKFITQDSSVLLRLIQNNDLDLLLITETWLPLNQTISEEFRDILPRDYNVLSNPRFFGRGGGVAIVFNERAFRLRHVPFTVHGDTFEYVAGSLRRRGNNEPILILNIYRRPNQATPFKDFIEELRTLLCSVFSSFRSVIITGDFNIWMDCPETSNARNFQSLLNDFNLQQHVSGPTHNRGHTLDLVLTNSDVGIAIESMVNHSFSDHKAIVFTANTTLKNTRNNNDSDDLNNFIKATLKSGLLVKRKKKAKKNKRKKKRTYKDFNNQRWKKQ